MFVSDTAIVGADVDIGSDVYIWNWVHIMDGVTIGSGASIGEKVFIGPNVHIGSSVRIQNAANIFEGVWIDDYAFIGPGVCFSNVKIPRVEFPVVSSQFTASKVGRGASLGANCTIICGVEIGDYAVVGAGSVVTKRVKKFELVIGNPARHAGWISRAGAKLNLSARGFAQCPLTSERYFLDESAGELACYP